ncbi:MAG: hypothetical protein LBE12_13755 [Planctomycetaceae bacterium]|jgi:uncharacterized membrane protein YgcG|nr:hypothetical protein [Planctomycetaceae bacterium]
MAKKTEFSLELVKKYIFWACIPIGLLFPVFTTYSSVNSITKAFNDRKNVLENTKKTTEGISSDRSHPNEITISDIQNCCKDLRGRVMRAWRTLEKDQRERNLWPEDVGREFSEEVTKLKFFDEMTINARENYLNFVEKYLPNLEVFVDRRRVQQKDDQGNWKEMDVTAAVTAPSSNMGMESGMDSGRRGNSEMPNMNIMGTTETALPQGPDGEEIYRYVGTVDWPNPETRAVPASWVRLPKSNEVWFAQEELWVYHALLSVIKESNTGATGPHNAVVKRIENLLIGQAASAALEARSSSRISNSSGAASMGSDMSSTSSMSSMEGSAGGLTVARTEEDVITIKKNNRYVDDKAKPLKADEKSPFDQFKRMPICLRLIVDQRRIPEILVSCANCSMPIDVLWVRINPAAAKPFDLSAYDASINASGGGSDIGGMSGRGSDMGDGGGYSGTSGGGRSTTGDDTQVRIDSIGGIYGTNAIPIEIHGCINIFNPVEHGGLQQQDELITETNP